MKLIDREWMVWRVLLRDRVKTTPQYWSDNPRPDLANVKGFDLEVSPYARLDRSLANLLVGFFLGYKGRYSLHGVESDGEKLVFTGTNSLDLKPHQTSGFRVKVSPEIISFKSR